VLGNPPWDTVEIQEKQWFSVKSIEIAEAQNAATRKKLINQLKIDNPDLWNEFIAALRQAGATSFFFRHSGKYPYSGTGRVNLP
jgi:hypothetical protein